MDVVKVEGVNGPLRNLVATAWKQADGTYRILLDNPRVEKFLVITVDVRPDIPAAVPTPPERSVMITIESEATSTCGLCRKESKVGVWCEVAGIGHLFLDWSCLRRLVALKSTGAVRPRADREAVEAR